MYKGDPFEFINIHSVAKYQKTPRGDPLGTSGFVVYLEKVKKNERGTVWIKFALASGGFRIVSKKWTDQCEDCSLKKKKGHCYSRAFFLKRKTRRLKMTQKSLVMFTKVRPRNYSTIINSKFLRLSVLTVC